MSNEELTEELQEAIIRKLEKWKAHSSWYADIANRQLISKFNEPIR